MFDPSARLEERVRELGNHHRKFLHNIITHKEIMIDRLEACGLIDQIHLWSVSPDLAAEMDIVMEAGRDTEEKAAFLGCFYALQFLHMNIRAIDVLALNLTRTQDRYVTYRQFMREIGNDFRTLTVSHMEELLRLLLGPAETWPEFVICGVGTRADQDDLDVGIIDDGSSCRKELNTAIGRIQRLILKQAVPLHFYLSEHVGTPAYSASIPEYNELLKKEIQDFVIITEMLGAARIAGSTSLFRSFRQEVMQRYYYKQRGENRYHEGYLRGLLGEVQSLLLRKMKKNSINPKEDGLRMIKGTLYAGKTIFNIGKVNAWDILALLETRDTQHGEIYHRLNRSLTFMEIFRFLYQLFVVQEDEIFLQGNETTANLQVVAETMGYRDVGVMGAWDHLLIHYYEHVEQIKDSIEILLTDVVQHLKSISVFSSMLNAHKVEHSCRGNLAADFIGSARFFRRTKFWDDVMSSLEGNQGLLLDCFIRGFNDLDSREQKRVIDEFADWSHYAFMIIMRFLVALHTYRNRFDSGELFRQLNEASLETLTNSQDVIQRLTRIFNHYPQLVHQYLLALPEEDLPRFMMLLKVNVWEEEVSQLKDQLHRLCRLHYISNRFFKRFFQNLFNDYPEYIRYLDDTEPLKELAKGFIGKADNVMTFEERKDQLGHYHDIEFFRVGLETLSGAPIEQTNEEFTEFSDNYLQTLFDVCKQEVEQHRGHKLESRDLLAVLAAGGHAREQAFDDDYDIIILLNSSDEAIRRDSTAIISKMNAELVKRGIMPHYRFADRFGHYVTLFDDLDRLLQSDTEDVFIDQSQLLGARMVVGSRRFGRIFRERIIQPYIYDVSPEYIRQMSREIESRHGREDGNDGGGLNIKEDAGGLRDIEMVMLMYKAAFRIEAPVSSRLFGIAAELTPEKAADLAELSRIFSFQKHLRDLYRLTVAAEDTIWPQYLHRTSAVMGNGATETQDESRALMDTLRDRMLRGRTITGTLSEYLQSLTSS